MKMQFYLLKEQIEDTKDFYILKFGNVKNPLRVKIPKNVLTIKQSQDTANRNYKNLLSVFIDEKVSLDYPILYDYTSIERVQKDVIY